MSNKQPWTWDDITGGLVLLFVVAIPGIVVYFLASTASSFFGEKITQSIMAPVLYTVLIYIVLKGLVIDSMEKMKKRIQELENKQRKIQ